MEDILIFGFGLAVTLVVGFGLVTYVTAKNRALDAEKEAENIEAAGAPALGDRSKRD